MTNTKRNIGRYNNIKFNKCFKAKSLVGEKNRDNNKITKV